MTQNDRSETADLGSVSSPAVPGEPVRPVRQPPARNVVEAANRIFREALTCDTEEQLGRVCLAAAEELTASEFGVLAEIDAQGRLADIAASDLGRAACRMRDQSGHTKVPTGFQVHGIYGRVLLEGKGFFTNQPVSHPDNVGTPEGHPPVRAFLGVPLHHAGEVFGMLALANREGGYGANDLEAIEALAPAIVHALMHRRAEQALREARDQLEVRVGERTAELTQAVQWLETEVAKRTRAEEEVRAERQRLYDVLETLPAYVVLLAPDYHVPFANRFFRERFGESHGRRCHEYLFGRTQPCENCQSYTALETGAPHRWEWVGPDERDYDIHDFPFEDSDGAPLVLEMGIDVTERKRAEAGLREHQERLEELVRERTSEIERRNLQLLAEVAERQRAEEALRKANSERERSLAQLQAVLDHLSEGLVIADLDGNLFHWNPAAVAMHGFTGMEEGQRALSEFPEIFELSTPEAGVLPVERWPLARILRGEVLRDWEVNVRRHGSDWRRVFNYGGTLARAQDGQPLLALVSITDVTARKEAEAALQKAHDTLEQRVRERTEALRQVNRTLRMISDCNQALVRATSEEALVDEVCRIIHERGHYRMAWVAYAEKNTAKSLRPVASVGFEEGGIEEGRVTWADDARGRGPTGTCIRTGKPCLGRDYLTDPDLAPWREEAARRGVRSSIALPLVARGETFGALTLYASEVGVFGEEQVALLTELADDLAFGILARRAAIERDHARQVAEERARQLGALATELGRVEQRERQRLAGVLHDHLQQLLVGAKYSLASIAGTGRALARQRALRDVTRILDDAIAAASSLTAELSPPALYEKGLVPGLEWLSRQMRQKHGLRVQIRAEPGAEPADEQVRFFLFEAARELLFNVVKHAKVTGARLDVAGLAGGEVRLTVQDDGAGFDPALLESGERASGGFGLFAIRERLRYLGGRMIVESRPGRGSRFVVVAPAILPTGEAGPPMGTAISSGARPAPAPGNGVAGGGARRIRVLLADDHAVMREGLARLLGEQADVEVVGEASNGLAAVELAVRLRPDVVLMDVSMPHLNGIEATERLVSEIPGIRVIGLSMHEDPAMASAMREAGAAEYLTKSGPPEQIVAAARACAVPARQALPDKKARPHPRAKAQGRRPRGRATPGRGVRRPPKAR